MPEFVPLPSSAAALRRDLSVFTHCTPELTRLQAGLFTRSPALTSERMGRGQRRQKSGAQKPVSHAMFPTDRFLAIRTFSGK
jgi:hypothetical protein